MNIFLYDKTFEGLLSVVYYAYDLKIFPDRIYDEKSYQDDIFASKYTVISDSGQAQKVWETIKKRSSKETCQKLYKVYLSELPGIEMLIFKYIELTLKTPINIEKNYSNATVVDLNKIYKKVIREAHRIFMFTRFQKTKDGIYFAPFEPLYDVLSLSINHFKDRFGDQKWLVYDTKRNYGFFWDKKEVTEVTFKETNINTVTGDLKEEILDEDEILFQDMWRDYFKSVTIKERKNIKLHKQFLPKRFWKYLPEKKAKILS